MDIKIINITFAVLILCIIAFLCSALATVWTYFDYVSIVSESYSFSYGEYVKVVLYDRDPLTGIMPTIGSALLLISIILIIIINSNCEYDKLNYPIYFQVFAQILLLTSIFLSIKNEYAIICHYFLVAISLFLFIVEILEIIALTKYSVDINKPILKKNMTQYVIYKYAKLAEELLTLKALCNNGLIGKNSFFDEKKKAFIKYQIKMEELNFQIDGTYISQIGNSKIILDDGTFKLFVNDEMINSGEYEMDYGINYVSLSGKDGSISKIKFSDGKLIMSSGVVYLLSNEG